MYLEVKINKEIRNYTESVFFGLSLRQFICAIIGCGIAVICYFTIKPILGLEVTSWICMVSALPVFAFGFLKYNGMPLERLVVAFIKSEFLTPKELKYKSTNMYEEFMKDYLDNKKKEELKRDKIYFKYKKTRKGKI